MMAKIKDYKVITACYENQLEHRVKSHIEKGFEPIGGVSICGQAGGNIPYTYAQAVVNYYDD